MIDLGRPSAERGGPSAETKLGELIFPLPCPPKHLAGGGGGVGIPNHF